MKTKHTWMTFEVNVLAEFRHLAWKAYGDGWVYYGPPEIRQLYTILINEREKLSK
jgi:hypothetical protein